MLRLLETRRVFVAIVALGLFAMGMRSVTDPDVWWHLRTGQLILQTHSIFHTDPYSFTRFGQPWVNHEWLSDILIFGLYRVASWGGLIVGFGAIIAATNLLVYLRCPGRPYVAAVVTLLGAIASAPIWGARPQILSLLLASVLLLLLERSDEHPHCLWWTLPLLLLWVNLHAGYATGIILLALFLVGGALDRAFGREHPPRHLGKLTLALAACLAIVPLNPNGVRMYWYPLQTLRSAAMQSYIQEWFSPNFHDPKYLPLLLLLLGILMGLAFSPRRLLPRELVLLLATLAGALSSVRHIPIFVLVAVPILSGLVQAWLDQHGGAGWLRTGETRQIPGRVLINAALLVAFAGFVVARILYLVPHQAQAEEEGFPAKAVSFVSRERPPAPILNHYSWGGYLIWKLYPQYRVYLDGRADLYGDASMESFAAAYYLRQDWRKSLEIWGIRTIVLPTDAPLVTALRSHAGWHEVYEDSQAVVLTRTNPQAGN